jgi:hypothetical protein
MKLQYPFGISGRLMPALTIGNGVLSLDDQANSIQFWLDIPGQPEYLIDDFRSPNPDDYQGCFEAILSFMMAAVESRQWRERNRHCLDRDSSESLFPPHIVDWLVEHSDEIDTLSMALEDEDLIEYE